MKKKLFKIGLNIYTTLIVLLIPIIIIVKASSFNKDYYPTSYIWFLAHLITTSISLLVYKAIKTPRSLLKQTTRYIGISLIFIGLIFQIVWSFDLFKENIGSTADIIIAIVYILLALTAVVSIIELTIDRKNTSSVLQFNDLSEHSS